MELLDTQAFWDLWLQSIFGIPHFQSILTNASCFLFSSIVIVLLTLPIASCNLFDIRVTMPRFLSCICFRGLALFTRPSTTTAYFSADLGIFTCASQSAFLIAILEQKPLSRLSFVPCSDSNFLIVRFCRFDSIFFSDSFCVCFLSSFHASAVFGLQIGLLCSCFMCSRNVLCSSKFFSQSELSHSRWASFFLKVAYSAWFNFLFLFVFLILQNVQ